MLAVKGHFQTRHWCPVCCFCHQFLCFKKRSPLVQTNRKGRHAFSGLTDVCIKLDGSGLLHEPSGDDGLEEEAMCVCVVRVVHGHG